MKGSGVGSGSTLFDQLATKEKATGRRSEIWFSSLSLSVEPFSLSISLVVRRCWGNRKGRARFTLHKKEGCGIPKTRDSSGDFECLGAERVRGKGLLTVHMKSFFLAWRRVRLVVCKGIRYWEGLGMKALVPLLFSFFCTPASGPDQ